MIEPQPTGGPLQPDPETDVVLDAKGLRALAHPVRVQLIGQLRSHGPSTATRLAERMGVGSGVTSYHLRQLGAAGFVEEDTERGNARERWWKAAHRATWFTDKELMEQEPEATETYYGSIATNHALRTQLALNQMRFMPQDWRHSLDLSDWRLRLTPEEALRLKEELRTVLARYRSESPETAAEAPEGAERILLVTHLLPEPDLSDEEEQW